jgi:hypothetical protein
MTTKAAATSGKADSTVSEIRIKHGDQEFWVGIDPNNMICISSRDDGIEPLPHDVARSMAKAIMLLIGVADAPQIAAAPVAAPAPIAAAKPAPPPTERAATRRWPWGVMKVGDHFFAAGNRPTINDTRATIGKRFATQAKTVGGVHGFLVWRMS